MNNNISFSVSENWNNNNISSNNSNNSSMVSFVGNNNPFNINPQTSIFDFSSLTTSLSSSPCFANFTTPNSQFSDYPSADLLKQEEESYLGGNGGRIGLNLGHRTYFSSRETALVDRLFRRPRGFYQGNQVPRCQAEGCKMDLTNAKHYHRRHKVCEFHSKATKVVAGGLEQRFCQQCSRFHVLAEFDQAKRSCRKRLADHNRRRRKTQQQQQPSSSSSSTSVSTTININAENAFLQATNSTSEVLKEIASTTDDHHQRRLIFNQLDSTDHHFFHRSDHNNSLATVYQNHHPLFSDASLATRGSGGSEQGQHSDELQNLLRLRQTMSEVELL